MEWILFIFTALFGAAFGVYGTGLLHGLVTIFCFLLFLYIFFIWSRREEHRWITAFVMYCVIAILLIAMWIAVIVAGNLPKSVIDFFHLFFK
ncbi:MAG: hypothetical protein LiPW41_676 [Parcubacteria group bacterium LiPW_41]|nr:MAG: hypothetical protein LiPW41_676 [Parcubacteria group bacterium LiPW_41]